MNKPQSIHFVGIKGVGMTPLSIIAKEAGILVTGSDLGEEFITDVPLKRAGITPFVGFSPDHVGNVDLVITTGAHGGYDNPEVKAAKARDIPVITKGEAVGAYLDGTILGASYQGISVAGTHGKTTTAAMISTILMTSGKDPGYLIGTSEIPSLGGMPGHFGKGQYFIAEADEYANEPKHDKTPQFLHQHPKVLIITNIEHDHPDIYPTIDDVREAFLSFARQVPPGGLVILCGDGSEAKKFRNEFKGNLISYGFSPLNDFVIANYHVDKQLVHFTIEGKQIDLGMVSLPIPGEHNALNSVAAILASRETGVALDDCKQALFSFSGTKRRLELKGTLASGALFFDDYAHHPTEIISSLHALKRMYPEKYLLCIFQPHTYTRTKELFTEFTHAFSDADSLLLLPIYASSREAPDTSVSSDLLAEAIQKTGKSTQIMRNSADVVEYIEQNQSRDAMLIVTMGAGDVYKISDSLPFAHKNDSYTKQ